MTGTCTTANLLNTLENLNMTGTFGAANATLETTIPHETIGLYQLIDKHISEVVKLKNTIKANEKVLITKVRADFDGTTTLDDSTASRSAIQEAADSVSDTRGSLTSTPADKPAIITSSTSARNYSEDAIFALLRGYSHAIININGDVAVASQGTVSTPITAN